MAADPVHAYLESLWAESPGSDEDNAPHMSFGDSIKRDTYRNVSKARPPFSTVAAASAASAAADALLQAAKSRFDGATAHLGIKQHAYEEAALAVSTCEGLVKQADTQLRSLREEELELQSRSPLPLERLKHVRQWAAERTATVERLRDTSREATVALLKAESQLRAAETELDFLNDSRLQLEAAAAVEREARMELAATVNTHEAHTATNQLEAVTAAARKVQQHAEERDKMRAERISAAQEAQRTAKTRLRGAQQAAQRPAAAAAAAAQEEAAQRARALLDLKQHIGSTRHALAAQQSTRQQVEKQRREQQEAEFQSLLDQGLNPYEVYRRRDIEQEVKQQRQQVLDNIARGHQNIEEQVKYEERRHAAAVASREREKQLAALFSKDLGPDAVQKRLDAYMRTHTTAGVTLLDPTGRAPVYPSQATLVETRQFGLGGSDPALVRKIARQFPDVTADTSPLLSTKRRNSKGQLPPLHSTPGGTPESRSTADASPQPDSAGNDDGHVSPGSPPAEPAERDDDDTAGKTLKQHKMSKLEERTLQRAKERHRQTLTQPRKQLGRTFSGDAFLASPPELVFRDFEPGVTYQQRVSIINRSYTKNTFRLQELPGDVWGILAASMKSPGFLAPGASADVLVTFTPTAETQADVETQLPLLAETGAFQVPIRCLTRKAELSVSPADVDFDTQAGVVLGETVQRTITIRNQGALEVQYRVLLGEPWDKIAPSLDASVDTLTAAGFTISGIRGAVGGYSQVTLSAAFAPTVAGNVHVPLIFRFRVAANGALAQPDQSVRLMAVAREVPLFAESSVVDFKCCTYGTDYRQALRLRNAGRTAMKVSVHKRADLAEYLEFLPDMGFCQGGEALPVAISFKPRRDMLEALQKYVLPGQPSVLEIPMQVNAPGQPLPVRFTIRAQVTAADLVLQPRHLEFGPCNFGERSALPLHIRSGSLLPQAFAFTQLPPGVSITPNDGFGVVLPGETLERLVCYCPPIIGPQTFRLTCRTVAGVNYSLTGAADARAPPLILSHNDLKLPATVIGDVSSASVIMCNGSAAPQCFEFTVPDGSYVSVTPQQGTIPAGSSLRVQVDFSPPLSLADEGNDGNGGDEAAATASTAAAASAPATTASSTASSGLSASAARPPGQPAATSSAATPNPASAASGAAAAAAAAAAARPALSVPASTAPQANGPVSSRLGVISSAVPESCDTAGDPAGDAEQPGSSGDEDDEDDVGWHLCRQWLLPCYIRPAAAAVAAAAGATSRMDGASQAPAAGPASSSSGSSSSYHVVHLGVSTCAVEPELLLQTPLPQPPGKSYYSLDFGSVPVGERAVQTLSVVNVGFESMPLRSDPLDTSDTFSLIRALRALLPGEPCKLLLCFNPRKKSDYYEMLTLRSPKSRLRIALRGVGVAPEVRVTPPTALTTGLDLGDVAKGESRQQTITVTNISPFPITFSTRFRQPAVATAAGTSTPAPPAAMPLTVATNGNGGPGAATGGVFFCRPAGGTLAPNEAQEVVVVFQPQVQLPYYRQELQIEVPNQQVEQLIPVRGRCWEEGVFLAGPEYPAPLPDPFQPPNLGYTTATPPAPTAPASAPGGPGFTQLAPRVLVLKLPGSAAPGQTVSATMEVGSLKSAAGGSNGEILIEDVPAAAKEAGWSLDVNKVSVSAGDKKTITIKYTAPAVPSKNSALSLGLTEMVKLRLGCTMKGGVPPPATSEGTRVQLEVRCAVQPAARNNSSPAAPSPVPSPVPAAQPPQRQ